jgi:hypothetical protein
MLTKFGGVSLRKPSEIALIMQELQQGIKKLVKPPLAAADDNDLSPFEWVCKVDSDILASYDLDAYVSIDDDVTAETQTEKDTAMEVKSEETNELEEGEDYDQKT